MRSGLKSEMRKQVGRKSEGERKLEDESEGQLIS